MKCAQPPSKPVPSGTPLANERLEALGPQPQKSRRLARTETRIATPRATPAQAAQPVSFLSGNFYTLSAMTVLAAVFAVVQNHGKFTPNGPLPSYDAVREQLKVMVEACQKLKEMPPECKNIFREYEMTRSHTNSWVVPVTMAYQLRDSGSSMASVMNMAIPPDFQDFIPALTMLATSILVCLYAWQIQAYRHR